MRLKALFVGELWNGSTGVHRADALSKNGLEVYTIDITKKVNSFKGFWFRVFHKLHYNLDINGNNKTIIEKIGSNDFNILWLDKCTHINKKTLQLVRKINSKISIIGYSPDDMMNPNNQTSQFRKALPYYDVFITTKSYNVPELSNLGCKNVLFIGNSFDPNIHKPIELSEEEENSLRSEIGFIGSYEDDRCQKMISLANAGFKITITGKEWEGRCNHENIEVRPKNLWALDYAKAINATTINLCFLRKANRDLQTTRSIEIPACKGFMLAERTEEHKELFTENEEAVYFESESELIEKVRFYLNNKDAIKLISEKGYARCFESGYSNFSRLEKVLNILQVL